MFEPQMCAEVGPDAEPLGTPSAGPGSDPRVDQPVVAHRCRSPEGDATDVAGEGPLPGVHPQVLVPHGQGAEGVPTHGARVRPTGTRGWLDRARGRLGTLRVLGVGFFDMFVQICSMSEGSMAAGTRATSRVRFLVCVWTSFSIRSCSPITVFLLPVFV